jgi:hypothetical protein
LSFQQFLNQIQSAESGASQNSSGSSDGNSNSSSSSSVPAGTTQASCEQSAPAGASQQAIDYLNVVNAGDPGWVEVSQIIENNDGQYNLQVLQIEAQTDKQELSGLQAIDFTGSSAPLASQLESALSSYISDVDSAASSPDLGDSTLQAAMDNADTLRSDASSALRQSLGLPQSDCSFMRPG